MTGWIAARGPGTAGRGLASGAGIDRPLPRGTLLVELQLDPARRGPVTLLAGRRGPRLAIDPARGLWLLQDEAPALGLAGSLAGAAARGLRLLFSWDSAEPGRRLWCETAEGEPLGRVADRAALPLTPAAVAALFDPSGPRPDPAVQLLALTPQSLSRAPGLGVGAAARIRTPDGPRPAGALRLGDLVTTVDHGAQPIRWLRHAILPACGSLTPVRLRAPFFGTETDLILAPNQPIRLGGAEVEYLFGEDEVLAQAARLLSGRVAVQETRRAEAGFVALGFERPEVFLANGCGVASLPLGPEPGPGRRELARYEAVTLLATRDRARNPLAA